ncbi:hypothetical protein [Burkholderia anthina]|uniref:hypothetical protein n=1 Tax=Burkholderia anthina TaxID=179879 RepID=UPI001589DAC2|nr:hypothetical protein [Burkholderia anthina]
MAKVLCRLPNASEAINGVKFISHKLGMLSEEIDDDVAAVFLKIDGYVKHSATVKQEVPAQAPAPAAPPPAAPVAPAAPAAAAPTATPTPAPAADAAAK